MTTKKKQQLAEVLRGEDGGSVVAMKQRGTQLRETYTPRNTVPTNFRVSPRHVARLRSKALELHDKRGWGKVDASEALREVLDEAIDAGRL